MEMNKDKPNEPTHVLFDMFKNAMGLVAETEIVVAFDNAKEVFLTRNTLEFLEHP